MQAIREEINRFENVHPRIYAVYDILDALPPEMCHLGDQMRQHVAAIEDSFVNSQEWTLSRGVKELRLVCPVCTFPFVFTELLNL